MENFQQQCDFDAEDMDEHIQLKNIPAMPTARDNHAVLLKSQITRKTSHSRSPLGGTRMNENVIKYRENKEKKVKQLRIENESKLMQQCTFQPQTNKNKIKRNLQQFLSSQQKHLNKIDQKTENRRKQINKEIEKKEPFHPKINEQCKSRNQQPVYERLYRLKEKERSSWCDDKENQPDFKPKIQQKSALLQRSEPIDQLLYQDALRRSERQANMLEERDRDLKPKVKPQKSQKANKKYVAQKFIREFYQTLVQLQIENQKEQYSLKTFRNILSTMDFIKYAQETETNLAQEEKDITIEAYELLAEYGVNPKNTCVFLMALVGIYDINPVNFNDYENKEEKEFNLDEVEGRKVQKYFDLLFRNKLSTEIVRKSAYVDPNTYTPEINYESTNLAEKYRSKMIQKINEVFLSNNVHILLPENGLITHQDLLVIHNIGKNIELDKERERKKMEGDPECTFKPNTLKSGRNNPLETDLKQGNSKSNELYEYAKIKKEIEERQQHERELSNKKNTQKIKTYTDAPVLKNHTKSYRDIKNVDKVIARMNEGRKQRVKKEQYLARGEVPAKKRRDSSKSRLNTKRTFDEEDKEPFLVVDVNIDEETIKYIKFFEGDELKVNEIVESFCQAEGIDHQNAVHLLKLVEEELSSLQKH